MGDPVVDILVLHDQQEAMIQWWGTIVAWIVFFYIFFETLVRTYTCTCQWMQTPKRMASRHSFTHCNLWQKLFKLLFTQSWSEPNLDAKNVGFKHLQIIAHVSRWFFRFQMHLDLFNGCGNVSLMAALVNYHALEVRLRSAMIWVILNYP